MNQHRGVSGWAGAYACRIDEELPGFLGDLQRAHPGRRQIVFAGFSKLDKACLVNGMETANLGSMLSTATKVRNQLHAYCGSVTTSSRPILPYLGSWIFMRKACRCWKSLKV